MRGLAYGGIAAFMLLGGAACAGSECNFNSQCGPNRYCADSVCRQDCSRETDCPAGRACSPIGKCEVPPDGGFPTDSGREPDSGARDGGPGDGARIDAGRDAGRDSGARDSGPRDGGSADMGPAPGTRGYLVDCAADVDCASGKCIAEGAGSPRVCTTSCTRDRDCADWHFCVNFVDGDPGFCALDDIGRWCSGETSGDECAFACIYDGPGSGHCTHRCSTAADCAGGYACVLSDPLDVTSGKVCAWVHKACPSSAAECPTGLGGCGGSPDGTQCSGACASASDCPPIFGGSYTCTTFEGIPLCAPPTAADGASGEPCFSDWDCRSGGCALVESGAATGICIERCNPTAGCAEGFGCNAVYIPGMGIAANVCVPAGSGRSGTPCTLNRNCRSGACSASSGVCIDSCQSGFCPPGFTCTPEGITVDGIMLRSCRR